MGELIAELRKLAEWPDDYGPATTSNLAERAAAALEAAREDAWQPIETAPKDGRMYLCWVDAIRYGERDDGSLDSADVSEVDFGQWRSDDATPHGGYHMNMMGDIGDGQIITHWRPLPTRPAIDQARGKGVA